MDRGLAGGAGFCAGARHGHDLGFTVTATADRNAKKLRHDLENFASDAEGADAASLETAEMSLVPLSEFIDELKATVPVTLLFLDACRSNPFPPGALLKKDGRGRAGGSQRPGANPGCLARRSTRC